MDRRKLSGIKPNLSANCLGRKGSHHPKRLLVNQRDMVSRHDGWVGVVLGDPGRSTLIL